MVKLENWLVYKPENINQFSNYTMDCPTRKKLSKRKIMNCAFDEWNSDCYSMALVFDLSDYLKKISLFQSRDS